MKEQLKIGDKHLAIILKCLKECGYAAALAKEIGVSRSALSDIRKEGKTICWDTWIGIVKFARRKGIVGPFFDVITLEEPPAQVNVAAPHGIGINGDVNGDHATISNTAMPFDLDKLRSSILDDAGICSDCKIKVLKLMRQA